MIEKLKYPVVILKSESQEWRQFFVAFIAVASVFTSCYASGWSAPIVIKLRNPEESPLPEATTVNEEAWIGSLLAIGAIFGPYISGVIMGKLGRKWAFVCTNVPMLASWVLLAVSTSLPMLYAGRILAGLYVGMSFTVSTLYLGEIATKEYRAAVNSLLGVGMNSGMLLAYAVGPYVSFSVVAYIGIALAALNLLFSLVAIETPYYHLAKGDLKSAASVLMKLRGKSREAVQDELDSLDMEVKESIKNTAKFSDTFRGNNRTGVILTCGLLLAQQLSGINAVQFYMTNIFESAGTQIDPHISTIIIGAIQLALAIVAPMIIDRLRRRLLLLISLTGMIAAHSFLGMYFYLDDSGNPVAANLGFLPLLCLIAIIVAHIMGLGPIAFVYAAEIIPAEVRSIGMSLSMSFYWMISFLVTRFFGPISAAMGMAPSFWIFGGCCFISFIFVLVSVPETKGKSLHEIQNMLKQRYGKGSPATSENAQHSTNVA